MDIASFNLMRNELILVGIVLIMLVAEIFTKSESKNKLITLGTILFGVATLINFLPLQEGMLFVGSFQTTRMTMFMKSILNLGVFIVFLQSNTWLKREDNHGKIGEFFILIISTLIGMNFMISSGDFLMMYI